MKLKNCALYLCSCYYCHLTGSNNYFQLLINTHYLGFIVVHTCVLNLCVILLEKYLNCWKTIEIIYIIPICITQVKYAWLFMFLICGLLLLSSLPSCYGSAVIIIDPPIASLGIYRP